MTRGECRLDNFKITRRKEKRYLLQRYQHNDRSSLFRFPFNQLPTSIVIQKKKKKDKPVEKSVLKRKRSAETSGEPAAKRKVTEQSPDAVSNERHAKANGESFLSIEYDFEAEDPHSSSLKENTVRKNLAEMFAASADEELSISPIKNKRPVRERKAKK